MKKRLPQIKKNIKAFILEEDAKVIDKTAIKITLALTFAAFNFVIHAEDANAKGHYNHSNHNNHVFDKTSDPLIQNNNEVDTTTRTYSIDKESIQIEVPPKSISAAHGNHYNHQNGSKK